MGNRSEFLEVRDGVFQFYVRIVRIVLDQH